jgi:hypothetical protein
MAHDAGDEVREPTYEIAAARVCDRGVEGRENVAKASRRDALWVQQAGDTGVIPGEKVLDFGEPRADEGASGASRSEQGDRMAGGLQSVDGAAEEQHVTERPRPDNEDSQFT